MKETAPSLLHFDSHAGFNNHPSVKRMENARHGVLLHHRVSQGNNTWHVITRRLLEVVLPEADNSWSYETAVFPEHDFQQPDLTQGHYTRYGTETAAVAGHRHTIHRLMQHPLAS
ncbi:MAG TPA: hypothetical protein VH540_02855 [Ktedonobacterales bacterium]|jgi:hypothetical protein